MFKSPEVGGNTLIQGNERRPRGLEHREQGGQGGGAGEERARKVLRPHQGAGLHHESSGQPLTRCKRTDNEQM